MLSAFACAVRWLLASSSRLSSSVSSGLPGSRIRSTRSHSSPCGVPISSLYLGAYCASPATAVTSTFPSRIVGGGNPGRVRPAWDRQARSDSLPVGLADMTIDATMVGRSYTAAESYQVGQEKIREFAGAIGDPNPAYTGDD